MLHLQYSSTSSSSPYSSAPPIHCLLQITSCCQRRPPAPPPSPSTPSTRWCLATPLSCSSSSSGAAAMTNSQQPHSTPPLKPEAMSGIRQENIIIGLKDVQASNGNAHTDQENVARLGTHGKPLYTNLAGIPVSDDDNSVTIGGTGALVFEDVYMFEKQAHFNRERIPERVVHAKGAGAHGYFEVTKDVQDLCKAKLFSEVGKHTPIFGRFSTVSGESGYPDTARDPRGFSIKFYTEDGNWDMVGNNTPIFFMRDALKFPDFIHSQKRNPQTHMKDPNAFWDFLSLVPESLHQVLILFSPRGVPDGFRHMNGYGSHTFKWVNAEGKAHWVKFHFKSDQGIKNLTHEKAIEIAGINPDYAIEDLFQNIKNGNFPSWTFFVQVMPLEDAANYKWDPFDLTKVWPHKDYPLREVGKLVLNRNPTNYFAEVEQSSFSPAHMVPGIGPSPDRVLQARLFTYDDTARYRIGPNYLQVPINRCPFRVQTYASDGPMNVTENGGSRPNYYPNSFEDLPCPDPSTPDVHPYKQEGGVVGRYTPQRWKDQDDYDQPRALWQLMSEEDQDQTVNNVAGHIMGAQEFIIKRQLDVFRKCDEGLASRIEAAIWQKRENPGPYSMVA